MPHTKSAKKSLRQNVKQRARNRTDRVRLYEVRLPEQEIDGVIFKPTTKYLRIEE